MSTPAFILGPTGRRVYLEDPFAGVGRRQLVNEIATGLSNELRFSGHLKVPYTVAQHSISVAESFSGPVGLVYWHAIMHDASEAYLRDLPKPLKTLLPDYQALEKRFMQGIHQVFGLPGITAAQALQIHAADWAALCVESDLIGFGMGRYGIDEKLDESVYKHFARHVANPLSREAVRGEFISRATAAYENALADYTSRA